MHEPWEVLSQEHTFSSGRSATLRQTLPVMALVRQGVFTEELLEAFGQAQAGALDNAEQAVALVDAIVCSMFRAPRVLQVAEGEPLPEGTVPLSALEDAEIEEVVELAFASVKDAATFRGDAAGARAGSNGKGVDDKAESAARPAGRKRGSAPRRPAARPKARK